MRREFPAKGSLFRVSLNAKEDIDKREEVFQQDIKTMAE
jgi:hypothetical protein